jgi:hypothetical protein
VICFTKVCARALTTAVSPVSPLAAPHPSLFGRASRPTPARQYGMWCVVATVVVVVNLAASRVLAWVDRCRRAPCVRALSRCCG